ncbi:hypothetical protein GEMRC1_006497 [Eukaryota sp. GEM-RC1]
MTEPLITLQTTDGTLDNVSSSCFSSMRTSFDTFRDSLFRHKPSIYFHESLFTCVNLHLIKRLINRMLKEGEDNCPQHAYPQRSENNNTPSYLQCLYDSFLTKVGYVSDRFFEFSFTAVKVFFKQTRFPRQLILVSFHYFLLLILSLDAISDQFL